MTTRATYLQEYTEARIHTRNALVISLAVATVTAAVAAFIALHMPFQEGRDIIATSTAVSSVFFLFSAYIGPQLKKMRERSAMTASLALFILGITAALFTVYFQANHLVTAATAPFILSGLIGVACALKLEKPPATPQELIDYIDENEELINCENEEGYLPIEIALRMRSYEAYDYLLAKGADTSIIKWDDAFISEATHV